MLYREYSDELKVKNKQATNKAFSSAGFFPPGMATKSDKKFKITAFWGKAFVGQKLRSVLKIIPDSSVDWIRLRAIWF